MKNRFIFRPDLSNGLTGNEVVTVPNLIIFGSIMAVKRDRAPMLPLISKAMKSVFDDPKTPFIKIKAMDILFNGFEFNCDGSDFSVKAVCAAIKAEGQGVKVMNETYFSVSILGHVSSTRLFTALKFGFEVGKVETFKLKFKLKFNSIYKGKILIKLHFKIIHSLA